MVFHYAKVIPLKSMFYTDSDFNLESSHTKQWLKYTSWYLQLVSSALWVKKITSCTLCLCVMHLPASGHERLFLHLKLF